MAASGLAIQVVEHSRDSIWPRQPAELSHIILALVHSDPEVEESVFQRTVAGRIHYEPELVLHRDQLLIILVISRNIPPFCCW
jgi:hypothetical protein